MRVQPQQWERTLLQHARASLESEAILKPKPQRLERMCSSLAEQAHELLDLAMNRWFL